MPISFGEFIRKTRDERDISLREMAALIGCSPAFLSDIELGKRYPADKFLTRIAETLKVKKSELEKYDTRSAVDDFKKATIREPQIAFAFRQIIDKKLDPEKVLKAINALDKKSK